jgi:iron complex outermembrane receptor protein
MFKIKLSRYIAIMLIVLPVQLAAQPAKLIVKDKTTNLPLENVIFISNDAKGYSNQQGEITINYNENENLTLSHLSYGTLVFNNKDLLNAIRNGFIQMEYSSPIMLNPVSVYALKEKNPSKAVRLESADWVQHDAGQVLQQIPGFDAVRKSIFGFDPVFRGFKLDQINIISDGALSATAACPNRMDPPTSQIPINQVNEIEVIRGPHCFRYGPSMGATINFKSAAPNFSDTLKSFGRINTGFESNGKVYRSEGQIGFRTSKSQIGATGSYSKGSDYKDGGGNIIPAKLSRGTVGLNADFQTGLNKILSLSVNRNFARNTDFPTLPMDLISDDTWMIQTRYNVAGKNNWYSNWNTQIYSSFVDHKMSNSLRNPTTVLAKTDAKTINIGGRTEITLRKKQSLIFMGLDGKYENITGNRLRTMLAGPNEGKSFTDFVWQDGQLIRLGTFADLIQQTGKFKLSFSGRVDVVNGKPGEPAESFLTLYPKVDKTDINPSLSAGISRQWTTAWFTGFWIGRGVRSANITERFINSLPIGKDPYEMMGNPTLKPEANNQVDVMISYKTEKSFIELSTFYSIVNQYISSIINADIAPKFGAPGVRQFTNIDNALLYGFELSWYQDLFPKLSNQLKLVYTYGQNKTADTPLPEIVPFSIRYNVEGKLLANKIMPYVNLRHSFAQNRIANDFGEKNTSAFTVVDIGIKMMIFKNLQSLIAIENLFNEEYREHLSRFISPTQPLNSLGRSLAVNISYTF